MSSIRVEPGFASKTVLALIAASFLSACNSSDGAKLTQSDGSTIISTPEVPSQDANDANDAGDAKDTHDPVVPENPATPTPAPSASPTPSPSATPTPTDPGLADASSLYVGSSEFEPYVRKFVNDAKSVGVDVASRMDIPTLDIRLASLDSYGSSTIGLCETSGNMRRVTFDPDFWNSVSETQRVLVSHHELGHCVLYRGHRTTTLSTGAYASIMYPTIMSSSTFTKNQAYYLEELFTYNVAGLVSSAVSEEHTHVCDHGAVGL